MIIEWILVAAAVAAAFPCAVVLMECLLGSLLAERRVTLGNGPRPRTAVVVPAHDESAGVAATVAVLKSQLAPGDLLLVVADNCSDDTAEVAARSGATVIERRDPERHGKGYALAFGFDYLSKEPPDVVIVVDADCGISAGSLERLARMAHHHHRPVQADNVIALPERAQGYALINALAFLVKNRVRPRGLAALGLPCLLTGTGMAFPWDTIVKLPAAKDNLVEDMVMGIELARLGYPPMLCSQAHVTSELPERVQAAMSQRTRWEHGHMTALRKFVPKLFAQGIAQRRFDLIALALDLMVPPLALLVLIQLGGLLVSLLALLIGVSAFPPLIFAINLLFVALGVLLGWHAHGRTLLRASDLLAIPLYILWKLPLYLAFFTRRRQVRWERTERGPSDTNHGASPPASP